jgi:hypothetical protein
MYVSHTQRFSSKSGVILIFRYLRIVMDNLELKDNGFFAK